MKYLSFENAYLLRLEKGEEVTETLLGFCKKMTIRSGWVIAIGASDFLETGFFDTAEKKYHRQTFEGLHEIAPLTGNIAIREGEPMLHLHITFAGPDLISRSGHLFRAIVNPTLEVKIECSPNPWKRSYDASTGLYLLDFPD